MRRIDIGLVPLLTTHRKLLPGRKQKSAVASIPAVTTDDEGQYHAELCYSALISSLELSPPRITALDLERPSYVTPFLTYYYFNVTYSSMASVTSLPYLGGLHSSEFYYSSLLVRHRLTRPSQPHYGS